MSIEAPHKNRINLFPASSATPAASATAAAVPTRDQIDARHRWNLDDLYTGSAAWSADLAAADECSTRLKSMHGRIDSAADLAQLLKLSDDTQVLVEKVYAFAMLHHHEDTDDQAAQADYDRARALTHRLREATAWILPTLLALPEQQVAGWIDATPDLRIYRHWWHDVCRQRPHVRTASEEEILALAAPLAEGPNQAFSLLTNADMKFGTVVDDQGREVELTAGRYQSAIFSTDRRYRRETFLGLHRGYAKYANTIAALLGTQIKRDVFFARVRGYGSAIESALSPNNIPVAVYDQLVATINRSLPLLHRYTELRRRVLKLDELHAYDLYVSLVPAPAEVIPYDDAVETVQQALAILGPDYAAPMQAAFSNRWIDVYETRNKRSGAYSMGVYAAHPYLLLNHTDTANARSTLAHELGHAMHSWFTRQTQPPVYGDYTIFCAEVASTVNEALLNEHLLQRADNDIARMQLINASLENIRTTVFRQTLFAEFERTIHAMAERDEPLTAAALQAPWRELYQRYYGPALTLDPELDAECLRIPHFYRGFYVYQYATSYCAATDIAARILRRDPGAVDGLLTFLRSGSSNYSIELLRLAGVDMTTAEPFERTMGLFERQLGELERLLVRAG